MKVKEGGMHAQIVYLHPYCLVARLDKIHMRVDGKGDFFTPVCVCRRFQNYASLKSKRAFS